MKNWLVLCLLPLTGALGALLGGYRPVDLSDPSIEKLRSVLQEASGELGSHPVASVEKQQLFKVTNYKVHQSTQNGKEICTKITCHASGICKTSPCKQSSAFEAPIKPAVKTHLLGGQEAGKREDIAGALSFAVDRLNGMSNNMFRMVAEDVTNITKQVVSGMMYRFTVSLVTSACLKSGENKGKTLEECGLASNAQRQQCHVKVWQKLNGDYSLEEQQCGRMQKRSLNTRLGGDGHDLCHVHLKAFQKFKDDFKKQYSSDNEEAYRFQTFCDNMKRIKELQDNEQGTAVYGITKFADISEKEFRRMYLTPTWDLKTARDWMTSAKPVGLADSDIPESFDWRERGAVTPVKNQGACGSCWAFSTTGNIEGQWAIKSKKLVSLSEQELVDCDKMDKGCNGGLPSNAYKAIMKLGGLESEKDYSYKGEDEKCHFNRTDVAVKINGGVNISSDEKEMKAWLYKNGPISIGINAFAMQFYFGGISYPFKIFCNPDKLDHGVLIVGYNVTRKNEPYWIIKNSWGDDWGEKGYYLVYRGAGVCGLNRMCTSATIN